MLQEPWHRGAEPGASSQGPEPEQGEAVSSASLAKLGHLHQAPAAARHWLYQDAQGLASALPLPWLQSRVPFRYKLTAASPELVKSCYKKLYTPNLSNCRWFSLYFSYLLHPRIPV